jgi:hypothetical protein
VRSACHSEITRALVGETQGGGALAERHKRLDFRDPHTMALQQSLPTPEDLSALARSRVAETQDMGNVSADGKRLWVSGRFDDRLCDQYQRRAL